MQPGGVDSAQRRWLWLAAPAVLLVVAGLMIQTVDDLGITWDEPVYRYTQTQMAAWFAQLGRCRSLADLRQLVAAETLHEHWIGGRYGKNFHPPMAALLNNASHAAFGGWMGDMPARRFASALELAAAAVLLFLFVGRRYGYAGGAVAAASLCLIPRVFGHANLAATDMPMLFFWAAIALAFWRAVEGGGGRVGEWASGRVEGEGVKGWWVAFGVLLGMGFLVKLPTVAVLLPIVVFLPLLRGRPAKGTGAWRRDAAWLVAMAVPLLVVGVEVRRQAGIMWDQAVEQIPIEGVRGERWGYLAEAYLLDPQVRSVIPAWLVFVPLGLWLIRWLMRRQRRTAVIDSPVVEALLAALAWAPAVAVGLHPGWWRNTLVRLGHYYLLCTQRSGALPEIEIFYLGRKYVYSLPWHNGLVLLGVTVPFGILALGACGAVVACLRVRRDRLPMFLLLNLLALPVVRMLGTPAHDGVRLMLPAFFFLAALAGIGFGAVCDALVIRLRRCGKSAQGGPLLRGACAAVFLLPALVALVRSHPYELSYYNTAVAALPGASRVGFEVSYWYDALNPEAVRRWHTELPEDAVPKLPATSPDEPSSAAAAVWMSLTGEADPQEQPDREGTSFLLLLTHASKSQANDRLIFAMRPTLTLAEHRGVRLLSVYDARAMARAQALTILCGAAGSLEDSVSLRRQLDEIRRAQPQAVVEAERILAVRGADVARIVRYEGYVPDAMRAAYLDDSAPPRQ